MLLSHLIRYQGKTAKQDVILYQLVEKSVFSKKVLVFYPYKNALWALRPAKPLGVLSRHPCRNPKPLPRGEGLCMLGWLCVLAKPLGIHARHQCRGYFAGATAPRPSKDACSQSHQATMQGRIMTAAQSRCTMQRHKWLSMHRCSGTNG